MSTDLDIRVTTTFEFDGYKVAEYKGIAKGIIVRSPTIAQGILGSLKALIGGQIGSYRQMCEQGREQAFNSLLLHAKELGANAILGLRYDTSEVAVRTGATEVFCYGTAVVLKKVVS